MPERPNLTVARDLMREDFPEIELDASLQDAMNLLVEMHADEAPVKAIVAVDGEGNYAGLFTARLLFRSLLTLWMPSKAVVDDERRLEAELLQVARQRLDVRVQDALILGLPAAAPDDALLSLIVTGCEKKMDFIPVVENKKVVGLVPITSVLQKAASLALTPEDEGIQHGDKKFK